MFPRRAFPAYGNGDWSVFTPQQSTVTTDGWVPWTKPLGCKWIYFYMQASGAGGTRPADGAVTTQGGPGGGSGGCTRLFIPALFLPDALFIRPGVGGAGAITANTTGTAGTASFISTRPETTTAFLVMTQAGGTGTPPGSSGGAGAVATATSALFKNAGIWVSVAGQAGNNGGSFANGTGGSITPYASGVRTTGGAGGGNGTGAGGAISAGGWNIQAIPGGVGTTGGAGSPGRGAGLVLTPALVFNSMEPSFLFSGGSGGGGHTTGAGGRGGDAGYGAGGGGGGAASGAGTSGNGGNGGDGYILAGAY